MARRMSRGTRWMDRLITGSRLASGGGLSDEAEAGQKLLQFFRGPRVGGLSLVAELAGVIGMAEALKGYQLAAVSTGCQFVAEGDGVGIRHGGIGRRVEDNGRRHLGRHLIRHGAGACAGFGLETFEPAI